MEYLREVEAGVAVRFPCSGGPSPVPSGTGTPRLSTTDARYRRDITTLAAVHSDGVRGVARALAFYAARAGYVLEGVTAQGPSREAEPHDAATFFDSIVYSAITLPI